MEKKESIGVKVVKRFYGVNGVLDEYKRQEVNRIGNNSFMVLWGYMLLSSFVAFMVGLTHPTWALWILLVGNSVVGIFGIGLYIMSATISLDLGQVEVEKKHYEIEKQRMKKKGRSAGLFFGGWMFVMNELIFTEISQKGHLLNAFTLKNVLIYSLSGLFFGSVMYVIGVANIQTVEE